MDGGGHDMDGIISESTFENESLAHHFVVENLHQSILE